METRGTVSLNRGEVKQPVVKDTGTRGTEEGKRIINTMNTDEAHLTHKWIYK